MSLEFTRGDSRSVHLLPRRSLKFVYAGSSRCDIHARPKIRIRTSQHVRHRVSDITATHPDKIKTQRHGPCRSIATALGFLPIEE